MRAPPRGWGGVAIAGGTAAEVVWAPVAADSHYTAEQGAAQGPSGLDAPEGRYSVARLLWSCEEIRRTLQPDVQHWAPYGARRTLRRLRAAKAKVTRRTSYLHYSEPARCGGHWHGRHLLDGGDPVGRRWLHGLPGTCACTPCCIAYLGPRLRRVDDHGGLTSALHFVVTTPSEISDRLTIAALAKLKEWAAADVRASAAEVLELDAAKINLLVVIHPTGDSRPTDRQEHADGFASAPGLERLADPALLARFHEALARRWRRRLSRFAGEVLRPIRTFARWYPADKPKALRAALADSLRSFAGWNLGDASRVSFSGPWRRLPAGDDIPRTVQGEGFAGAIPVETMRSNIAAWRSMTDDERGHYEGLEAEARSAEEARERAATLYTAPSARSRPPADPDALLRDEGIVPVEGAWVWLVDVSGVGCMDPRCHGSVAAVVADADATLAMTLRRIGRRIGTAQRRGQLAGIAQHVDEQLAGLRARVRRRTTPSSARAARWILDRLATDVPREARDVPPPTAISGLLDVRELRSLSARLRRAAATTGANAPSLSEDAA